MKSKVSGKKLLALAGNSLDITRSDVEAMTVDQLVIVIRSLSASVVAQSESKIGESEMAAKKKETKAKAPAPKKAVKAKAKKK